MKTTSRTKHSKPAKQAKRPVNRNADRAALTDAHALIAERPTMKAKAALRKVGVTSSKKIELLSEIMSARPAVPLQSKENDLRKSAFASSTGSERAEAGQKIDVLTTNLLRSKQFETVLSRYASLPYLDETEALDIDIASGMGAGTQLTLWSRMFRWSPYGMFLWQAAVMTDVVSKTTKSFALYEHRHR